MNNAHIRRGRVADVEESRRVCAYLKEENKPRMKKDIIEGSLISEEVVESCLNFLKHIGVIKIKRKNGKKLYYYSGAKRW